MHCTVLLHSRSAGISGGLTYDTGDFDVKVGMLVTVQLRKKSLEGLVIEVKEDSEKEEAYSLKTIEGIIGTEVILSEPQLQTLRWMAEYYFCSLRSAATPFLPSTAWKGLLPKKEKEEKKRKEKSVTLSTDEGRHAPDSSHGSSVLTMTPHDNDTLQITLSPLQQTTYDEMKKDARTSLLFGITGSGKTEVYAKMIHDAMMNGKESIFLVPEILLTEHTIHRLEQLFPRNVIAVIHSRLTASARKKEWMRIRNSEVKLIIGSRSALFAPCPNLGLIVIDEEHEWTYKNEQTPRYHARETAEALCKFSGAKLVLGTATPSLESWAKVKSGEYQMSRLPERYKNQALPTVRAIDLATVKFGSRYPFSPPLLEAIEERLKRGEQSVLFLNRRGSATSVLCLNCRRRLTSPASNLPFTLHEDYKKRPYLLDHFTGIRAELPAECPHCKGHQLFPVGAGTQKIEEILTTTFPAARILRADSDTLQSPEDMRTLLQKMRDREADILLGTQSVVKGLDLPEVTLAVVLVADVGMSLPHFRAGERVFQLLTQLTGRSGRSKAGEVIVQTFRPDSVEVQAAAQHRTEDYLNTELTLREQLHYPPSVPMIRFIVRNLGAEKTAKALHADLLRNIHDRSLNAQAMVAPTLFGNGTVWHVLLRGENIRSLLPHVDLKDVVVDIDPIECL